MMKQSSAISDRIHKRFIVDRDITDNTIDGIFVTIQEAIDAAASHSHVLQSNKPPGKNPAPA